MPNPNVSFQGASLILPGAYYADNVSAVTNNTPPTTPPMVFIGQGYGPQPLTLQQFASSQDLYSAIRGGPAADFLPFIADPSPQLNGAQLVTFISVGASTQSTLTLSSSSSGEIVLTSAQYGIPSNLLQAGVYSTTTSGITSTVLTMSDAYSNTELISPVLGPVLQLAYTGAATGVGFTLTTVSGYCASMTVSGATTAPLVVPFATPGSSTGGYSTVQAVAEYLGSTGLFAASVLGDGNMPVGYINGSQTAPLPAPSGGSYNYAILMALNGSIIYWINTYAAGYATAALAGGKTYSGGLPLLSVPPTFFAGATSVVPTTQDYANAFNLALTTPAWTVITDTSSTAVMALGNQHAQTASQVPNNTWRRFFTGNTTGTAISGAVQTALSMDSITTTLAYPGIYRTDPKTGVNRLYSALYVAAAAAAMATGNIVATPLTNKALNANGVEFALNVSQINTLQQAGIMVIRTPSQTNVPTITSDLTTWQLDNNPENIFNQQVACRWWLAYSITNAMNNYIGTIASPLTEVAILNAAKAVLNALIYTDGSNGVIANWDQSSLVLKYTGETQTASITVKVTLVGQNRFVTVYVPIQPLTFSLTATAS